jgi:hypothetical protein
MKQKQRKTLPLHPFFFALASVVSLFATNKSEIRPISAVRLAVIMLVVALVVYLANLAIFRNRDKAAFVSTILLVMFSTYGQVMTLLRGSKPLAFLGHHTVLILICLGILAISIFFIARMKKPEKWTGALNIILGLTLVIPLFQSIAYYVPAWKASLAAKSQTSGQTAVPSTSSSAKQPTSDANDLTLTAGTNPDVYFIVLDSYGRQDALMADYGFDNSQFIADLRQRGFYVADCSRSNYGYTRLSLSSTLNMNYLETLGLDMTDVNDQGEPKFQEVLLHSQVRKDLSKLGYKTVAFETGYIFTDLTDADVYYKSNDNILFSPYIEGFEYLYLQNSAFLFVMDTQTDFMDHYFSKWVFPFNAEKASVQNIFKKLPTVAADVSSPKFVFVHVEVPHHPFIFMPDGSINPDKRFYPNIYMPEDQLTRIGYINQVQYVNSQVIPAIDKILADSKQPPIIIIEGDHGLLADVRLKNLYAIYLPGAGKDQLYSTITPINTFRIVFNNYFGTDLPLLEDRSYISTFAKPMDLTQQWEDSAQCVAP